MVVQELGPVSIKSGSGQRIIDQIASMHAERLKAGFLPSLGASLLARVYRCAAGDPNTILLADLDGRRVRGFVMGTFSTRAFYLRFMARNVAALAWSIARRPATLLRAMSVGKYAALSAKQRSTAELLSIAVGDDSDRRGIGSALLKGLEARLAERGVTWYRVIVSDTQRPALAFYLKHGGTIIARTSLGGLPSYVLLMHPRGTCNSRTLKD